MKKQINHGYYSHLSLNGGAYFFERGDVCINNDVVSDLFDKVAYNTKVIERRYRIRENGIPHSGYAFCSLLVFTYPNDVRKYLKTI